MTKGTDLGRTALFAGLDETVLEALGEKAIHRKYRKGNVIFVQGEQGERCFTIVEGAVKISAYHPDGREAVMAVLGPGDVFGELSLFDNAPRSADATAIENTELLSLDTSAVTEAIRLHPELAIALLRVLGRRLRHTNEALQDIAFFDVPGRVARRIADLADAHGEKTDDGVIIELPLSQENLAQMVGATRESVNKALSLLKRRGLVTRVGRRYLVTDVQKLRSRAK
ncbi:MAG TPA: Crp/Fnr family transcriptional regulator [Actinomycetota bacterium]|jgi:CRP/FNR family transcriptional regulator|nr:Crp/Fnr family transcriptional regulator [Actinomycetota bacterium]